MFPHQFVFVCLAIQLLERFIRFDPFHTEKRLLERFIRFDPFRTEKRLILKSVFDSYLIYYLSKQQNIYDFSLRGIPYKAVTDQESKFYNQ